GSSGPLLLPRIDEVVSGGKDSSLLVYDKNNLGKYNASDVVVQKFIGTGANVLRGRHFGGLVYWEGANGPMLFAWPDQGKLLGFKLGPDKKFDPMPAAVGPDTSTSPRSGFMAISSDGPRNGVLWANVGEGDTS